MYEMRIGLQHVEILESVVICALVIILTAALPYVLDFVR